MLPKLPKNSWPASFPRRTRVAMTSAGCSGPLQPQPRLGPEPSSRVAPVGDSIRCRDGSRDRQRPHLREDETILRRANPSRDARRGFALGMHPVLHQHLADINEGSATAREFEPCRPVEIDLQILAKTDVRRTDIEGDGRTRSRAPERQRVCFEEARTGAVSASDA